MSIQEVARQYRITRDDLLRQYPDLAQDEEALLDTLEGITDFKEQVTTLLRSAVETEYFAQALAQRIGDLKDRRLAMQQRAERIRQIALNCMDDCGIKTIRAPDMTVSQRKVPPSVTIFDPSLVPDEYMRMRAEPDKSVIKDALQRGERVPGCSMSNGGLTLAIKI